MQNGPVCMLWVAGLETQFWCSMADGEDLAVAWIEVIRDTSTPVKLQATQLHTDASDTEWPSGTGDPSSNAPC